MRVSTNTIFQSGIARISELQSAQVKLQQQISTQRRILTPSDDPTGSARAIDITHSQSVNSQFIENRKLVNNSLAFEEATLTNVTDLLLAIKSTVISAGNGAFSDRERGFLAAEVRGQMSQLLGLANTRDGVGNFIFSGSKTDTQPFIQTATGATYQGDTQQQAIQVSTSRNIETNDAGSNIFQSNGQDVFQVLTNLASLLDTPVTDATSQAALKAGLATAGDGLDNTLDAVLTTRAMVGSRLNEVEALEAFGQELKLQYAEALSEIQDLDYAQALSDFTQKQTILEAAQKSFATTSQLSLFNYI